MICAKFATLQCFMVQNGLKDLLDIFERRLIWELQGIGTCRATYDSMTYLPAGRYFLLDAGRSWPLEQGPAVVRK